MARKRITLVEEIYNKFPRKIRSEFLEFCRMSTSYVDMKQRLVELIDEHPQGFANVAASTLDKYRNISISSFSRWYGNHFPIGDEVKLFNELTRSFEGVELDAVPNMLLVTSVKLFNSLVENLYDRNGDLKDIRTADVVQTIPSLLREIRFAVDSIRQLQAQKTIHVERMEASQRTIAAILNTFKDMPQEEAIYNAAMDAAMTVESWSLSNLD
jgi:hypothetical protein